MIRSLAIGLALYVPAAVARAESVPEFSLDYALEKATHIVVVDATGKVVERWKGVIKLGTELPFKAGAKPQPVERVVAFVEPKVKAVTGKLRVLFLIQDGGGRGLDRRPIRWEPALKRDISLATVWIEEGECFAIYQWMNPGNGAQLLPLNMTEKRLREVVAASEKKSP